MISWLHIQITAGPWLAVGVTGCQPPHPPSPTPPPPTPAEEEMVTEAGAASPQEKEQDDAAAMPADVIDCPHDEKPPPATESDS